jgi:outer membrane lipoprotein-sorting protein
MHMSKIKITFLVYAICSVVGMLFAQDAREIVRKSEDRARGKTSETEMSILTVRPDWQREMRLKTWTRGNDFVVIRITAPPKEKGIAFLKRGKEIWNWVPSIDRSIKLPPSMMSQSWMGTDFTNDDLVKESSIVEDYIHSFIGDTSILDRPCHRILMVARDEAAVVWSRVILCIDKKDFLMMRAEYYDEDGKKVNTLNALQLGNLGGRLLPTKIELVPADKKGQKTVMIYHNIVFDCDIPESFFTIQQLSRLR